MSSNYQQKKMMNALGAIDTKGNIVLEQFQDGTALLFQPGNAQPFCVATDYDRATASWSYGKYFSDLGCAHEAADPEIIEDASVRWGTGTSRMLTPQCQWKVLMIWNNIADHHGYPLPRPR